MAVYPYESASNELAGPWRRAALVAVAIAGVELIVLIVLVGALVAKPLSNHLRHHATAASAAPPAHATTHAARPTFRSVSHPTGPVLARGRTRILVLNGNGRQGAAAAEASALQARGYRISATGNAGRSDYATSIVMYAPGYEREARRLARDESIRVVAPLDGIRPGALKGAQLALVVGS
jgi:hypothetical protein